MEGAIEDVIVSGQIGYELIMAIAWHESTSAAIELSLPFVRN
jgi:hypothetical protein